MKSNHWTTDRKEQVDAMSSYILQLEDRISRAEKELVNLACGLVSGECDQSWDLNTKTRYTAANALRRILNMPKNTRPKLWW